MISPHFLASPYHKLNRKKKKKKRMMISPSPEFDQPPMYPTTHDEPVSVLPPNSTPMVSDPPAEMSADARKASDFGCFVAGEEMGIRRFGGLILAEDKVEVLKDGEFLVDLGKGLLVDDVGGGGGGRGVSTEEKLVLCDLKKGFAEDGRGSHREIGISLLESKKKQLLRDLESGYVLGNEVDARASEIKDVSEGTLVLDKFRDVGGTKKLARESLADDSGKIKGGEGRNEGFDLRRSLKVELIDDTAVVEQLPIREVCGVVRKENEMPSGPKKQKEVVDGKKACRARRKAQILGNQEAPNAGFSNTRTGRKLMYSRVEMEALRYVNVAEQQNFWSQVYDGLGPVSKEYATLLSERAQPIPDVDCMRQPLRKKEYARGIVGERDQF